ncbi:PadR family transcriptional regulator [Mycolicibacterium chubuense]|uniref:Transcriptional regulator PadR-like family protein n=1 Tax=Mycolicibacterium chubuense TaxID=1800 RepID=A0A0J6WD09_MYCCU|nr:PadR family transcriptional regulator [Mycolicibacterium chubuense]KMO79853.1 Transcriptional regulator PadR-like family protein [Mycolicibacterium chubuense]ORA52648.1 PadR family transcriptional regulator [Mycolicibacterium chubuense]SPX98364.1 PadR-like family transcriptional regulator [Mycolicibacterium chubuense]
MSLRIAALGLLAQRPGSGYDLLKLFENSMANVWPATQSQLYSELNKLADGGLIEVTDIGPRGRKVYRITTAGRAELHRWMTDPSADPPFRSAALLRLFLLGQIPQEQARRHLEHTAEHAQAEIARLLALRDSLGLTDSPDADDDAFFGLAALDYGLRLNAMQGEWARDVLTKLDDRRK